MEAGSGITRSPGASMTSITTILVVQHDPMIRRYMASSLRHAGFIVTAAGSAEAAFLAAADRAFDVITVDVWLPYTDGTTLARQLCGTDPETRLMLVSGFSACWYRMPEHRYALARFSGPFHVRSLSREIRLTTQRVRSVL